MNAAAHCAGYVGRYAPSPTGMLHLGNLRTVLAAYLHCRSAGGRFLLRIEDLDTPRVRPGIEERQLADLAMLGIKWDESPIRQSERDSVYAPLVRQLHQAGLAYPCFASRKEVREAASAPHRGDNPGRYPGIYADYPAELANKRIANREQHCWRLRVQRAPKNFEDKFAGTVEIDLDRESGDFVIQRADGLHAYQLACAVDDSLCGITDVLRGGDLLDSGARQAWILTCLQMPVPRYWHIPLFLAENGERLSKRDGADDMARFMAEGFDATAIRSYLACTLGQCAAGERLTMNDLIQRFNINAIPREDVHFDRELLGTFRP
jgi:glutamyl-tRNA synthetase